MNVSEVAARLECLRAQREALPIEIKQLQERLAAVEKESQELATEFAKAFGMQLAPVSVPTAQPVTANGRHPRLGTRNDMANFALALLAKNQDKYFLVLEIQQAWQTIHNVELTGHTSPHWYKVMKDLADEHKVLKKGRTSWAEYAHMEIENTPG